MEKWGAVLTEQKKTRNLQCCKDEENNLSRLTVILLYKVNLRYDKDGKKSL